MILTTTPAALFQCFQPSGSESPLDIYTHSVYGDRRRQQHPTPVLLPGKSHGWRSLVDCSPWGREESDTTSLSLSLFTFMHWRRKWQPTPVFLSGESQGWGSLVGCRLWGRTESDTTEVTQQYMVILYIIIFNDQAFWVEKLFSFLFAPMSTRGCGVTCVLLLFYYVSPLLLPQK